MLPQKIFFQLLEHALALLSKEADAVQFNVYAQKSLQQDLVKREKLLETIPLVTDCYQKITFCSGY